MNHSGAESPWRLRRDPYVPWGLQGEEVWVRGRRAAGPRGRRSSRPNSRGDFARDLRHRGRDARGAVLRRDDGVGAGGVGYAQAGAEVVRVGDTVEDEQERLLDALEHVVEALAERLHRDTRDDALMAAAAVE